MPITLFRRIVNATFAGLITALAACGGGGSSNNGGGQIGASDMAPAVSLQPQDASITAPFEAVFTAAASGSPAPAVQWQRSGDGGATWAAIAGATSARFATPALAVGDNGTRFRAVFSNAAGSATSNAAALTVTAPTLAPGLSLLAGDIGGGGNLDGTGAAARFTAVQGMAIDNAGNLYVADWQLHNIRKITPAGVVTTLAGPDADSGGAASGLVDGTGTAARFNAPIGVAVDAAGNVYVGDFGNYAVRKIQPDGTVTTLAGGQFGATDVDGFGTAAKFGGPVGVAVDSHGNVFVADQGLQSIRKITPAGAVSTFAGVSSRLTAGSIVDGTGAAARFIAPQGLTIDAHDNLYVGDGSVLRKVTPAAVVTTVPNTADITYAHGIAVDPAGNVFVADENSNVIRKIDTAGTMTTFAGTVRPNFTTGYADGIGAAAAFTAPTSVAADAAGNVFVGDGNGVIRKITPAAVVTTFAGTVGRYGRDDGVGATARFNGAQGIAVDASGRLFVADLGGNSVRQVTLGGTVTTLAGADFQFGSNDGTTATAHFRAIGAVASDATGNLFVADGTTVRKIAPDGTVSTLAGTQGVTAHADGTGAAAGFASIDAIATDAAGNVYVAEADGQSIRKITPAGVVTTLAGMAGEAGSADGTGSAARFSSPHGLAVDPSGNVIVADSQNNTLRKVTPAGVVTTLAGLAGALGHDDGAGAAARFAFPYVVTTDTAGNAYAFDLVSNIVRKVTPAGVVTTVVGKAGRSGVRLGTDTSLTRMAGICWLPTGQLALSAPGAVLLFTLP